MDFNTGPGGAGGGTRPPGRTGMASGGAGDDYNLSDPVGSFVTTARSVLLNPVGFFSNVRQRGNFVPPLIFAIVCALISGVIGGIIKFFIALISGNGAGNGAGSALGILFGTIILTPIGTAVGLFIWGGIYFLLVLLFIRPNSGYEATFRVVAYASVLQLFSWLSIIPILNIIVAIAITVYGIVLSVLGIREMHSTTTGRAVAVVLIPVAVLLLLIFVIGAVVAAILLAAFSQAQ